MTSSSRDHAHTASSALDEASDTCARWIAEAWVANFVRRYPKTLAALRNSLAESSPAQVPGASSRDEPKDI